MRPAVRLLVLLGLSACASPPTARHSGSGSGVECSDPGGFVSLWQLALVPADLTGLRAELTLEVSHPHDKWRPLVFVMLDSGRAEDAVKVELREPPGSRGLELQVHVLEASENSWKTTRTELLESDVAKGETRAVSLDWSRPGQLEVRVGEKTASVPLHFQVVRIRAGCSGADGRIWVPEG